MFNNSIPQGSPLVKYRPPATPPVLNLQPPVQAPPILSPAAPSSAALTQQLPPSPPKMAKAPSIWDKQHLSETLANISAGFLSSQNFGEGLGAAMSTIGGGMRKLRDEQKKSISYGGPEDQFEIATDANGNRSIRKVPEFAEAVEAKRAAAKAPTPKDNLDFRSRAVYAISQLPAERRAAAYQELIRNPTQYGISTDGMPAEWSDEYGTVAGTMGLNVNQSLNQVRGNALATDRMNTNRTRLQQGQARIEQGAERLRKAPPSTRKKTSNDDLNYF